MIDITLYRIRIGSFCQKRSKKCFKNIHHQKYKVGGNKSRKYLLEASQMGLKFLLLLSFFMLGQNTSSSRALPTKPVLVQYQCGSLNQPTESLQYVNFYIKPRNLIQPKIHPNLTIIQNSNVEDKNFLARYTYGNRRQHGINIVHWNKGSSFLENKKFDIEQNIQKYHPHIFGLSEANLFSHHDQANVQYPGYTLHTCPTISNPELNVSRVVVYTHMSLVVKPRPDLMDNRISAIWLEVGLPGRHKILICNMYREWGYLRQSDKSSHSLPAQMERWRIFIEKWEQALSEDKEVIVTGDVNINSLKWMRDDLSPSDSAAKLRPLTELLFEKIIHLGVSQ